MKSAIFAALLMAAASLQAMPASAQTFKPAPGRSFSFDLDTASGNYSKWTMNDITEVNAVRAKLAMRRAGVDKTFAPLFTVTLENDAEAARFRAVALGKKNAKILMLYAEHGVGGKTIQEMFLTQIELDEVVDLAIDWTPEGKVRIALTSKATRAINGAAEIHIVDIGKRPTHFSVSNSTSQLEVLELTAGGYAP